MIRALWECVAHRESLSWPFCLGESGGSLGLGWVLSSGFHALRPKPLPLDYSHCPADLFHFCLMYKYRNPLNLFLVVPHRVSFLLSLFFIVSFLHSFLGGILRERVVSS